MDDKEKLEMYKKINVRLWELQFVLDVVFFIGLSLVVWLR